MAVPDPVARLGNAIQLAQSGQIEAARTILSELTQEQPDMELAWLWLASVTDDSEKRVVYLGHVLSLNPGNAKAQIALNRLTGDTYVEPVISESKAAAPATNSAAGSNAGTILTVLAALIVVTVVLGGGALIISGRLLTRPTDTPLPTITPTFTVTPGQSLTPSETPGGPSDTPFVVGTLPPSWTPVPTDTEPPSWTPRPTDTDLPTLTDTLAVTLPTYTPTSPPPTSVILTLPVLPTNTPIPSQGPTSNPDRFF